MILFFVFLFGLIIGSFLNAVLYRLEVGGSLVRERSRCPLCLHELSWYELIPVLSFVIQLGKCRTCKKKIALSYPVIEISTGLLFSGIFLYIGKFDLELVYLLVVVSFLVLIFVFDARHYIIPNIAVFSLIVISFFYDLYSYGFAGLKGYLLAVLIAAGFFLALYLVSSGRWIGFGDVKYGVCMGLFLGWPDVLTGLFLAYILGAALGILLLILKRKKIKSEIPFGPFLIAGSLVAYFYGTVIVKWYFETMIF